MRYGPEHKTEIRQKIVKDASRRLRAEGMHGAAVAAVMRDTGLTHGGFYKHFRNKQELLLESLAEAFREISAFLIHAAEQSRPEAAWKAIVTAYLSPEHCNNPERGCPLAALAPELARADREMKGPILADITDYEKQMLRFMPGRRAVDRERAFFVIFSTMLGAVEISRMIPDRAAKEKVLSTARDFLLNSF